MMPMRVGGLDDAAGNEMSYLRIHLTESHREWWNVIKLRKCDEELLVTEMEGSCKREMQPRPVSGNWENVAKYLSGLNT